MMARRASGMFIIIVVACHSRGSPGPARSEPDETLAQFVVQAPELQPAIESIDDVLGDGARFSHLTWCGVNPDATCRSGIRLFVVDADRMAKTCRAAGASPEQCKLARQIDSSCTALAHQAIACDASFLLLLYSFATFHTVRHMINTVELGGCSTACWDEFFTETYAPSFAKQLDVAKHQLKFNANPQASEDTAISLHGFLMLVLWHELGHLVQHSTADSLAAEDAADDFALAHYTPVEVSKNPQFASQFLYDDLIEYYDRVAMLKAGMNDGRRTGATQPTPPQRAVYNREFEAHLCSLTHPTPAARRERLLRSAPFAAVVAGRDLETVHKLTVRADVTCTLARVVAEHPMSLDDPGAGPATTDQWNWPPVQVALVDPGRPPREIRRYHLTVGTQQLVHVEYSANALDPNIKHFGPSQLPNLISDARLAVESADQGKPAEVSTEILRVTSDTPGGDQGEIVRALQGTQLLSQLSPDGNVPKQLLHVAADKPLRHAVIGQPATQLGTVVLPGEPIGAGARWTVTQLTDGFVADVTTVTTFTLDAASGPHLKISASEVTTSVTSKVPADDGRLDRADVHSTATYDIDLAMPAPAFTRTAVMTTIVSSRGNAMESTNNSTIVQTVNAAP
jgi:hypothetical protein